MREKMKRQTIEEYVAEMIQRKEGRHNGRL